MFRRLRRPLLLDYCPHGIVHSGLLRRVVRVRPTDSGFPVVGGSFHGFSQILQSLLLLLGRRRLLETLQRLLLPRGVVCTIARSMRSFSTGPQPVVICPCWTIANRSGGNCTPRYSSASLT